MTKLLGAFGTGLLIFTASGCGEVGLPTGARLQEAPAEPEQKSVVRFTPNAVKKVRELSPGGPPCVRVGIKADRGGGWTYDMGYSNSYDSQADYLDETDGIAVIVDRKSALYLEGATVDYYESPTKQGFVFDNPNAIKKCDTDASP